MIKKIINEWDPIELFPLAPEDEYSYEILEVENYIINNEDVDTETLAIMIDNIFASSFGRDIYFGDISDCIVIAEKILKAIGKK